MHWKQLKIVFILQIYFRWPLNVINVPSMLNPPRVHANSAMRPCKFRCLIASIQIPPWSEQSSWQLWPASSSLGPPARPLGNSPEGVSRCYYVYQWCQQALMIIMGLIKTMFCFSYWRKSWLDINPLFECRSIVSCTAGIPPCSQLHSKSLFAEYTPILLPILQRKHSLSNVRNSLTQPWELCWELHCTLYTTVLLPHRHLSL